MLHDNPFFVRDIRMLGRRDFAALCRWIAYQSLALAGPLFLLEGIPWDLSVARIPLGVGTLLVLHWFSCLVAGINAGNRMFLVEHQKRTLESVLLISRSPWHWVPQKLLYSLYATLLVWLAGLPFYWAVALRGHVPVTPLLDASWFPLLAGVVGICHSLMISPEAWPGGPKGRNRHPFGRFLEEGLPPLWVEMQLFGHVTSRVVPEMIAPVNRGTAVFLFGRHVEPDHLMLIQTALLAASALGTAWWVANPGSRVAPPLARMLRLGCMFGLYALLIAALWPRLPLHERLFWSLGLPALWLFFNRPSAREKKRIEDPRAVRDVRQLQGWWDNPIFVRDVRALVRGENLFSASFRHVFGYLAVPLALAALTLLLPAPRANPMQAILQRGGVIASVLGPGFLFATGLFFAGRVRRFWDAERTRDTLGQLLGAPMSGRDLVTGRWAACAAAAFPSCVGALACCSFGLVTVASLRSEGVPPYLVLLVFAAAFGVGIGAAVANVPFPKVRAWHVVLAVPFVAGPILCIPQAIIAIFALGENSDRFAALALGSSLAYLALAAAFYVASLRNIEWLRTRELTD